MISVLAWNPKANAPSQADRVVTHLDQWPDDWDAAVLTEVKGCRRALSRWARRNRCRLRQERAYPFMRHDERGDTALLIRKTIRVHRDWVGIMAETWLVFSHGVRHNPRRHRRAVLRLKGYRVRLSGEHWPTRGNDDAWEESCRSAARFLDRRGPALVVGDLNATWDDVLLLAEDVGGKVKGRRPDWCVTNRPARIDVTELGRGGSDHVALLFKVED